MTTTDHRLKPYAQLPDRYTDMQVAASTVDAHGRVVTLLVPPEATCTRRVPPDQQQPYNALAVIMDGTDIHEVRLPDLDLHFPKIDSLGSGFVLTATHCVMPSGPLAAAIEALEKEIPHNAVVLAHDGTRLATFHAGDDIQHLLTDRHDSIWTGYGDGGCMCAQLPLNRPARSSRAASTQSTRRVTMSMPGVVRWTSSGNPVAMTASFGPTMTP